MKGYFECSKCKHQWETTGPKFTSKCPECGCSRASHAEIGGPKPEWYRAGTEPKSLLGRIRAAMERNQ